MFCSQCGKKLVNNAKFCSYCGAKVELPETDDSFQNKSYGIGRQQEKDCSDHIKNNFKKTHVKTNKIEKVFYGRGVVSGKGYGKILWAGLTLKEHLEIYRPGKKADEKQIAANAFIRVSENLVNIIDDLNRRNMKEQAAILEAHRMMVEDPAMSAAVDEEIDRIANAPMAVLNAYEAQAQVFESMEDECFRGRAIDMRDVGKRIAKYILGVKVPEIGEGKFIVAGQEIEPSVIASLPTDKIAGVILGQNSITAHAVIIAKAREIPTIIDANEAINKLTDGAYVTIDGQTGKISID